LVIFMKKIILFILALSLSLIMPLRCMADENRPASQIDDKAKSSVLMCMDTGEIIYTHKTIQELKTNIELITN